MKKPVFFLMFALVLLTVSSAFASEIVPLQFSYPPIDFPNIFLLPNGYYQAVYFTPNSSEFWLEQGHTDVSNCIVEVFDAFGQSVWNFPVLQVDILQEDADAFSIKTKFVLIGSFLNTIGITFSNGMFLRAGVLAESDASRHSTQFFSRRKPFAI